jgi:hypothetical protein
MLLDRVYGFSQIDDFSRFDFDAAAPVDYELAQNYPNPFNPDTSIRFRLPVSDYVRITILNLTGEMIATPVAGAQLPAGEHSVTFEAGKLPAGVYFYRISTPGFSQT